MIQVQGLSWRYGAVAALNGVSFSVPRGQVLGLLGQNGAGKTTLLRLLAGSLSAPPGAVRIAGHDLALRPLRAKAALGYQPERPPLYPEMTVGEYLRFCSGLKGVKTGERDLHVENVLSLTDLSQVRGRRIGNLSHGFRQRLGFAQALAGSPDILLLDEPMTGFDPAQAHAFRKLIRSLAGEYTVLLSSHLLREVEEVCDRVLILHGGRVVLDRALAEKEARVREFRLLVRLAREPLLQGLRSLPSVLSASAWPAEPEGCTHVSVKVRRDAPFEQEAFVLLCALQAPILRLMPAPDNLEGIFLQVTGTGSAPGTEAG